MIRLILFSKMIRLILFSAQAGRRTTDPVYHKPDNAKVLIIMDSSFIERVRNFHDSNRLASFSIRKFQLRLRKSKLDMVRKIPRTLMKSVLHFMLTGPSVLPAIEPNHMPSVLSKFNLDPEPFSIIRTISKALEMVYSSAKVKLSSSAYWLSLNQAGELP